MKREIVLCASNALLFHGQQVHAKKIRIKGPSKGTAVASTYDVIVNGVVTEIVNATTKQAGHQCSGSLCALCTPTVGLVI